MADHENDGFRSGGSDSAKVVGEAEDRPGVGDRTEVSVRSVGQGAITDEPPPDDRILTSLPSRAFRLIKYDPGKN